MKSFDFISGFLFLPAVLTFCACSGDDGAETGDGGREIRFVSFSGPSTKALPGEITGGYASDEKFRVFALRTSKPYSASNPWKGDVPGENSLYMNSVEVARKAGNNYWSPSDKPYYWPSSGYLTFAAYSPADAAGTISYGKAGLVIENFTPAAVGQQYDLMYTRRVENCTRATSASGVPLNFLHLLCSVSFKVRAEADFGAGTHVELKQITVKNAVSKATFKESGDNLDYTTTDGAWYWTEERGDYPLLASPGAQVLVYTADAGDAVLVEGARPLLLLPQHLKNVRVEVRYDIITSSTSGETATSQTVSLALEKNAGDRWWRGKKYVYTITVGLEKIYFSPTVEAWQDTDVPVIDV